MSIDLRPILIPPDSAKSNILDNVGIATSPFTGGMQITELPGAKWTLAFSYKDLSIQQGKILKAIAAMLRGGATVAHIYDLSYIPRLSAEPGVPVIDGAGQTGNLLNVRGVTANLVGAYQIGDQVSYLSTDGLYRMHMVTGTVNANAAGQVAIPIHPPLRNPPTDASAVASVQCSISVLADGSGSGSVSIGGNVMTADLSFVEALYALV